MMTQSKRVLLFDIDGTLLDPAGEGTVCVRRALEDVFGRSGPIETYDMSGKTDWQIVTDLMTLAGVEPHAIEKDLEAAFAAYARHIAAAVPTLKMKPLPGALPLLERLTRDDHFILGLLTGNVREAVPHKLRSVGIDPTLFRFGAFGSEHPDRNALPAMALHRLSQQLGAQVDPARALIIGDTPRDVACARHAGLKVLCVTTGRYDRAALAEHKPDYLLPGLEDLERVMEVLHGF
jgi:phosphoglycolate phosphatase-like HAD superfamily hydrolase